MKLTDQLLITELFIFSSQYFPNGILKINKTVDTFSKFWISTGWKTYGNITEINRISKQLSCWYMCKTQLDQLIQKKVLYSLIRPTVKPTRRIYPVCFEK